MYFEVDGTFPNHAPNPLLEENSREIRERVVAEKADLGIAWDGDADRCFFIDEDGEFVPGDFVTALLAEALLLKNPGAKILYDLRASRAVPDVITANGGVPLLNRVGHAFFKQRMRREGGLFGGEVSGHYYFADNYNADSGFIPALLILELLSQKKATMAELLEPLRTKYFISGEINSVVDDVPAALARIEERFSDGEQGHLDGISVDYDRLALQRAPVQHRAAAAPQPRRRLAGAHGGEARPRALRDPRGLTWATQPTSARRGRRRSTAPACSPRSPACRGSCARATSGARAGLAGAFFGTFPAIPPAEPDGLVVCGMGGSAIGADLVLACLPGLRVPATVVRGYSLPEWAGPETLVVVVSYSGETEEALACAAQARARDCAPVCVTSGGSLGALADAEGLPLVRVPGGGQPRAAVGSLSMPLLATLEAAGLCHEHAGDVAAAAAQLEADNAILGPGLPPRTTIPPRRSPAGSRSAWPWCTAPGPRLPSPGAGRGRSTRTPRLRPSSTSCRSWTTTSSWGGRACRTSPRPPSRSSSTTSRARSA